MCGICGILDERGAPEGAMERMLGSMRSRGPDGRGAHAPAPGVSLGHTRLKILDLSEAGRQPFSTPDGRLWLSFNGEIYNYRELRRELRARGYRFRSATDSEVLLYVLDAYGVDEGLKRLRGMFAFALWDEARGQLTLARDRLGIKPLYYAEAGGSLVFASSMRALLAAGVVTPEIDPWAVEGYLAFQSVPAPATFLRGVRSVLPGHVLTRREGRTATAPWWDVPAPGDGPEAAPDEVGPVLDEAVRMHLASDVPLGAFLSGGIDSSAIVALMARHAPERVRTFAVAFDEPAYDESAFARMVAGRFGTEHQEVRLRWTDFRDALMPAVAAMDQPSGDGLNTYVVSRAVRQAGITVALSGLGGDELFAGYDTARWFGRWGGWLRRWDAAPGPLRAGVLAAARPFARTPRHAKLVSALATPGMLDRYLTSRTVVFPAEREALLAPLRASMAEPAPWADWWGRLAAEAGRRDPLAALLYLEQKLYMHDTLLRDGDAMSMASSLEVRVPLLDHRVVETVAAVPSRYKVRPGVPKPLLVDALGGALPREVVHRPKMGFTFPFARWLRNDLRDVAEDVLSERSLRDRGLLEPAAARLLWERFLAGEPGVTWSRVWLLVLLELWCRSHLDGAGAR